MRRTYLAGLTLCQYGLAQVMKALNGRIVRTSISTLRLRFVTMFARTKAWQLTGLRACIVLLALIPNFAFARSTDQQVNAAYKLLSSGCVAVNNEIPFFKVPPDSASRTVEGESIKERRLYNKSEVLTLFGYGKLFIEQLTVPADSVPDELTAVFKLSLFEFFARFGVGTRRDNREYVYEDGLFEVAARFEKTRLIELKWTCDHD